MTVRHLFLSWARSVNIINPSRFFKIHFSIILLSGSGYYSWSLSITSPHQNPLYSSPVSHTCHMHLSPTRATYSANFIILDLISWIIVIKSRDRKAPRHADFSTPLLSTPLHSSPLHSTPLHSTPLLSSPLHSSPLLSFIFPFRPKYLPHHPILEHPPSS